MLNTLRKVLLTGVVALLISSGRAAAQTQPPSFEVASVRRNKRFKWIRRPWSSNIQCPPDLRCGISGNRFSEEAASLVDLITDAYGVRPYQIEGLPSWGDTGVDVYDINAKVEGDRTPTLTEARGMLQTLLADRFHLGLHHENKDLPVYALVIAKDGPRLLPSDDGCDIVPRRRGGRGANSNGDSGGGTKDPGLGSLSAWELLPEQLAFRAGRPVVDKTGLQAASYCTLEGQIPYAAVLDEIGPGGGGRGGGPPRDTGSDFGGASVFTAVQDKLGLKLEPQKAPVDVLVIDHVERPTEN
jgi:uncharacterized protein (TIGR03435 family)